MSFPSYSRSQVDQEIPELHSLPGPSTSNSIVGRQTSTPTAATSGSSSARKRLRRDSDPHSQHRTGKKMSKSSHVGVSDLDVDTDTEMATDGPGASPSSTREFSASVSGSASSSKLPIPSGKRLSSTMSSAQTRGPKSAYKRDETYYFEDGSCVILLEDTLFNVHRSILSRDNSSFSTMFSLPQGSNDVEGRSDDNPIVLTGDTPEEFRHFLWALYALPPDLQILTSENANITHMIDIARVSNKYSFKSLETWVLDAIQEYVNRKPSPVLIEKPPGKVTPNSTSGTSGLTPSNFVSMSAYILMREQNVTPATPRSQEETSALLTSLIRLAQLCQHQPLLRTMIALLRQLMSSSVHYAYLAMTLADELDLRSLRGAAYLEVMQKAVVVKKVRVDVLKPANGGVASSDGSLVQSEGSQGNGQSQTQQQSQSVGEAGTLDSSGRLIITRSQQLRLLAGYYRLTSTWDQLRLTPPPFDHSPSCSATWHQQGCTQSFLEFWKEKTRSEAVMGLGLADVLGRLRSVQKEYERWGSATYMHHDCRMVAKKAIGDVVRRVEEALPDYFAEPGGCEDDEETLVDVA